jgi:hypothetical protein
VICRINEIFPFKINKEKSKLWSSKLCFEHSGYTRYTQINRKTLYLDCNCIWFCKSI